MPVSLARTARTVFVRREQDRESQTDQRQRPVAQQFAECWNVEPQREDIPNVSQHRGKEPQVAGLQMAKAEFTQLEDDAQQD